MFVPTELYSIKPVQGKIFNSSFQAEEYYRTPSRAGYQYTSNGQKTFSTEEDLALDGNFDFIKDINNTSYYKLNNGNYVKVSEIDNIIKAFDTGGYTGQWGPEGRLAMLHQKEIVLNASDTANLLASVSLIRDITKQIDLQAAAAAAGRGSLAIRNFTDNAQTLQQDVTIHAEFPNVTNHNEIEQAFDTLINRAAQYTNRSF